jgi:hypothetical protein
MGGRSPKEISRSAIPIDDDKVRAISRNRHPHACLTLRVEHRESGSSTSWQILQRGGYAALVVCQRDLLGLHRLSRWCLSR